MIIRHISGAQEHIHARTLHLCGGGVGHNDWKRYNWLIQNASWGQGALLLG